MNKCLSIRCMSLLVMVWLAFGMIPASPVKAESDFYKYVDERGVVHLTNLPTEPRYQKIDPSRYCTVTRSSNWVQISPKRRLMLPRAGTTKKSSSYDRLISISCERHGMDQRLVRAVIKAESAFDPVAVSPKGAVGLMQLMPGTSKDLGVADPFDPVENIDGGVRYLKSLLDLFKNNVPLALAAYNAGPEAVQQYGGIPPYDETRTYVRRVLDFYGPNIQ